MIGIYNDSSSTSFPVNTCGEIVISGYRPYAGSYHITWEYESTPPSYGLTQNIHVGSSYTKLPIDPASISSWSGVYYSSTTSGGGTLYFNPQLSIGLSMATINAAYGNMETCYSSMFKSCYSLMSVEFPYMSIVEASTFFRCSSLSSVVLTRCTSVGTSAFGGCIGLTDISLPMCEYIGFRAFHMCSNLTRVNLPMCSYIDSEAFTGYDTHLIEISLPMCEYIGSEAFFDCYSLSEISLPKCSYIGSDAFYWCPMNKLTLEYESVCTLDGSNVFEYESGMSVYVPSSLVSAYQSAQYWSSLSSQIYPIPS